MILTWLPEGNFVQGFGSFKAHTPWTPNLVLTSFVQYDTESQNIGTPTRFRGRSSQATTCSFVWERGLAAADPKSSRRQHRARQRHRCSEAPLDIPAVGLTPRNSKDREKICPRNVLFR